MHEIEQKMQNLADLSAHTRRALSFLAIIAMGLVSLVFAAAQDSQSGSLPVYGPRLCVEARYWNTPGWQSRSGDYAYMQVVPGRTSPVQIRQGLGQVPETSRMLRTANMANTEKLLNQLINAEGFKVGALGYEAGGSAGAADACKQAQALAQKFGLTSFVFATQKSAEQLAGCADVLSLEDPAEKATPASVEEQRKLYQKLLAAKPKAVIFQAVSAASEGNKQPPQQTLRYYQANADLLQGIVVNAANARAQVAPLLRVIRPQLGLAYAAAPGEGPTMYFFTFHWKTPGWQPQRGDYATAKIRPQLKTFDEKLAYVLKDLKDVAPENRMLQFNTLGGSAELLKEIIETHHFPLAALGYDLEDWDLTSGSEKTDPVGACKYGQDLARKYGLEFIVTPDMAMTKKWATKVAPYIDAIKPQSKGAQAKGIDEAIVYQRKVFGEIRRANPNIRILHDLGISPKGVLQTPEGLMRFYAGVADLVDGIGVFSVNTPEQNAVMEKYIVGVRPPSKAASQPGGRDRRSK